MKKFLLLSVLFSFNCFAQDYSILQKSLEMMEQRHYRAEEECAKLQKVLGEIRVQLNSDSETLIWFEDYSQKTLGQVKQCINVGDYGTAINWAIRMQGEVVYDPEVAARIRTSQEYASMKQNVIVRLDWSNEDKKTWLEDHPYCFVAIKNKDEKVISGRLGTKQELELQIKMRKEKERVAKLMEEKEKERKYQWAHGLDNFDYSQYEQVFNNPSCKQKIDNFVITCVALSPKETRIEMEYNAAIYSDILSIDDMYIKVKGSELLKPIETDNFPSSTGKVKFNNRGEVLKFAIVFPPLPEKTKSFSIVNYNESDWVFKDVNIDYSKIFKMITE